MRFKYEDVVLEIIEGDAIHPQIFSFENQDSFYERINLALDEKNGDLKMIKKTPIKLKGNAIKLARSQPNAAFAHGCNCFNTMGKGMAVEVRTTCPDMYKADLQTRKGDRNKLGTFTMAKIGEENQWGFNLYSQFTYWDTKDMFSPKDFKAGIASIIKHCTATGIKHLYLPYIGCGLANYNATSFEQAVCNIYDGWQDMMRNSGVNPDSIPQIYFVEYRK